MIEIFLKLIEQLNSAVFVLILVLLVTIWVVWKLSSVVTLFGGYKEERKEVKDDLHQIRKDIAKIEGNVNFVFQKLNPSVQTQSPLNLTDKGKNISRDLNIEAKIAVHWEMIKAKIESKSPANPYDIQNATMEIARDCFDSIFTDTERNDIKLYAYKQGLSLLEIVPIIGIQARDQYFKEKNIDVGEIDKHAPAK